MVRWPRRFGCLALAVAGIAIGVPGAAKASLPTIYVNYNSTNCTFAVTNDAGGSVTTIPPGNYEVDISTHDPYGLLETGGGGLAFCGGYVQFSLTGPGVSLATTLDFGDGSSELDTETFQAGGTYTMVDANNPSASRMTFSVSTSGTAQSVTGPSSSSSSSNTTTNPSGSSNPNTPIGSATVLATLAGGVSAGGKLSLKKSGKTVVSLKTGRYTFSVSDKSAKAGFSIQSLTGKPITITSASFVGTHSVTVTLVVGHWSFFSPGGTKTVFFVLS